MRIVNVEIAKQLQERGFDGTYYQIYVRIDGSDTYHLINKYDFVHKVEMVEIIPAPRIDDALYWLENNKHIAIDCSAMIHDAQIVGYNVHVFPFYDTIDIVKETREDAFETTIIEVLKKGDRTKH